MGAPRSVAAEDVSEPSPAALRKAPAVLDSKVEREVICVVLVLRRDFHELALARVDMPVSELLESPLESDAIEAMPRPAVIPVRPDEPPPTPRVGTRV